MDKTELSFGEGITGVIGPNGCGKTNVSDAIRWVMGEQSARQLRGDSMEDVIFNGCPSRKPLNLAEVHPTFKNDRGILPLEFSEVTVSRRGSAPACRSTSSTRRPAGSRTSATCSSTPAWEATPTR